MIRTSLRRVSWQVTRRKHPTSRTRTATENRANVRYRSRRNSWRAVPEYRQPHGCIFQWLTSTITATL